MSYNATVYNVMIASPSDVASERSIVRDVVYEWNTVHSMSKGIVLLPIGWESHSSPEMGGSPQELINSQILGECDLLIGVFWTRIGTQTSEYASGTVEEIETHINADKLAMLYFSRQPVMLQFVDYKQFEELEAFKSSCQSRGLFESYESLSEFRDKFYRHLQIKLNNHHMFSGENKHDVFEPVESSTKILDLLDESKILLKEASLDPNGDILRFNNYDGMSLLTNQKQFVRSKNRRETAKWEAALEELIKKGLLVERGSRGESLKLTNFGYQVADMIEI